VYSCSYFRGLILIVDPLNAILIRCHWNRPMLNNYKYPHHNIRHTTSTLPTVPAQTFPTITAHLSSRWSVLVRAGNVKIEVLETAKPRSVYKIVYNQVFLTHGRKSSRKIMLSTLHIKIIEPHDYLHRMRLQPFVPCIHQPKISYEFSFARCIQKVTFQVLLKYFSFSTMSLKFYIESLFIHLILYIV
jgi:hypothetical protein